MHRRSHHSGLRLRRGLAVLAACGLLHGAGVALADEAAEPTPGDPVQERIGRHAEEIQRLIEESRAEWEARRDGEGGVADGESRAERMAGHEARVREIIETRRAERMEQLQARDRGTASEQDPPAGPPGVPSLEDLQAQFEELRQRGTPDAPPSDDPDASEVLSGLIRDLIGHAAWEGHDEGDRRYASSLLRSASALAGASRMAGGDEARVWLDALAEFGVPTAPAWLELLRAASDSPLEVVEHLLEMYPGLEERNTRIDMQGAWLAAHLAESRAQPSSIAQRRWGPEDTSGLDAFVDQITAPAMDAFRESTPTEWLEGEHERFSALVVLSRAGRLDDSELLRIVNGVLAEPAAWEPEGLDHLRAAVNALAQHDLRTGLRYRMQSEVLKAVAFRGEDREGLPIELPIQLSSEPPRPTTSAEYRLLAEVEHERSLRRHAEAMLRIEIERAAGTGDMAGGGEAMRKHEARIAEAEALRLLDRPERAETHPGPPGSRDPRADRPSREERMAAHEARIRDMIEERRAEREAEIEARRRND